MRGAWRAPAATVFAFAAAWLAFTRADPLIALLGLGELDLVLRVGLVFLVLGLVERAAGLLARHGPTS